MTKIGFFTAAALITLSGVFASTGATVEPWRTAHFENALGTSMEMKVVATSDSAEERAEAAALAEIKRLNSVLSGYDPTSEFSRWAKTRNQAVKVSPELMEVLKLWDAWRVRTDGALNPAAEAVIRVWKQAEKSGKLPSGADLTKAANAAGCCTVAARRKDGDGDAFDGYAADFEFIHEELHCGTCGGCGSADPGRECGGVEHRRRLGGSREWQ